MNLLARSHHERASDYASRLQSAWHELRKPEPPARQMSGVAIAGLAALGLVAVMGVYYGPDFVRYLKIRRM